MTDRHPLLLGTLLVGMATSVAVGGPIPSPLQGVTVSTRVTKDATSGIFTYAYRIVNPATNDGQISLIELIITRSPTDALLSTDGLANGPRYARNLSEDAFRSVPMVPVGVTGPEGWLYGLGLDPRPPRQGFVLWGSSDEPFRILPGGTLEGFELSSPALPGVRNVDLSPDVNVDDLPDEFSDPEKMRALNDSLTFHTVTVGPKAPPQSFVPLEFLNYLISLLHQSRANGWVTRDGVQQSLLAKLTNAKRKLEAGETGTAKNMLGAFLNEVSATSCQDFSCPGNKPLTSEAYALLFFNGQYLVDRLP